MYRNESKWTPLVWCFVVFGFVIAGVWYAADAPKTEARVAVGNGGTTIAGTGTGAIPDGTGVPSACGNNGGNLDISFDASALSGTVSDISIDMDATHTWVGDITATLIAPDLTEHVIFGLTGSTAATGCGSSDNLGAVYEFNDTGSADWWAQGSPYPAGTYRTTDLGGSPGDTGAATDFTAAFAGVDASGTWTLRVTDGGLGDTGTIAAANLTITTEAPAAPPILNELRVNPNGGDSNCEFVEILGAPSGALTNLYFASIEGDSTSTVGAFDRVVDLSAATLGSSGLLMITNDAAGDCTNTFGAGVTHVLVSGFSMENGTTSFALINSPTVAIVEGVDYDTANDGTLDGLPGDSTIIDGIGSTDGGAGDVTYGTMFEVPGAFGVDMMTRFPTDFTPNSGAAWYYGDQTGDNTSNDYDPLQISSNFPVDGMLTPGALNVGTPSAGQPARLDFDGDGKTDYTIGRNITPDATRGTSLTDRLSQRRLGLSRFDFNSTTKGSENLGVPSPGSTLQWWIYQSGDDMAASADFGDANSDVSTPADFDGDGKADIATWRPISDNQPSGNAFFFVLNSSDSTVDVIDFGIGGDNPTIVGDYDGDGSADPAVFRCPSQVMVGVNSQCTFYYQGSAGSGITYVPFGDNSNGLTRAVPGDYDGDGKFDFAVYRIDSPPAPATGVPSPGQYVVLNSSDTSVDYVNWGLETDFLAPGDYDGDGNTDFMNVRVNNLGGVEWWIFDGSGGNPSPTVFGSITNPGINVFLTQGDYDGDGALDIGIYNNDTADGNNCIFYSLDSSDGSLRALEWGTSFDQPINGFTTQ